MRRSTVLLAGVAALVLAGALLVRPLTRCDLDARPRPAATFEDAERRVAALEALDGPAISAACGTLTLSHGHPTPRVIVLLHGLTNCPAQFDSLGRLLFAHGANVLIPRLPRHGFADRLTEEPAQIDARELRDFTDRVIDAASGLGDEVVLVGLSVGGTMAAWGGQNRSEVDRVVIIAPLLAPPGLPAPVARAVTRLLRVLPNRFMWWDAKQKADLAGPSHVYPRFATRAAAASLGLGGAVMSQARGSVPACRSAAVVMLEHDPAVGNGATVGLIAAWRARGLEVRVHEFPDSLGIVHDMVDPDQVGARTELSYPTLMALIEASAAGR